MVEYIWEVKLGARNDRIFRAKRRSVELLEPHWSHANLGAGKGNSTVFATGIHSHYFLGAETILPLHTQLSI